ncbi:MAG TPA: EAL domain-containing protein [Acetobacteraceae bacterium]|jgi:diguanylate cyclase (GGDEF)-like protein|nr:EAL domain-containing protein [Acetobacteraceae bacterium]
MLSRIGRLAAFIGHARARYILVACGLVIGLVIAGSALLLAQELRRESIWNAGQAMKNLALVLSEETDRVFQTVELVQLGLIDRMREAGIDTPDRFAEQIDAFVAHRNLNDLLVGLPQTDALALIDLRGRIVNVTRTWPLPVLPLGDERSFAAFVADPAAASFISSPVQTWANGEWVVLFSRKFTASDGRFVGIVNYGLRLEYFEQLFGRISLHGERSFTLWRRDGGLLARYPRIKPAGIQNSDEAEANRRTVAMVNGGVIHEQSLFDGSERLIAPQSSAHYPLIITAATTVDAALAGWRGEARLLTGAVLLLELFIAGIIILGVRHLRGYEKLEAANTAQLRAEAAQNAAMSELHLSRQRERAGRELHSHCLRFDTALNNMVQGLLMFDHAGQLLVVNRRFCELFDVPNGELLPGMPYNDLTERIVTTGSVTADEMREVRERRVALISRNGPSTATWELGNGRAFTVTHRPMEEGWLTTFEEITERRCAEDRIAHLARHDALTNLPNRVLFHETLERAVAHARRGQRLALLCLDLDQFKHVNDTLGHPIGDALLQAVATRLLGQTRETDTVARLGGDEFAFIQEPIDKPTDATALAERLIELFDAPFIVEGHQIIIGTSIGIVFAPQDGLDPDQLLKNADLALYRAKVDGRGIYRLFHAEMDAQMQARRLLELDLRQALKVGQLELFYQPIVDLRANAVAGFEALLRWRHPGKGLVPPDQFIPLAEEIGLIVPIGEWVLREACLAAASWPGEMRVAVNLSPAQFKSRDLVTAVALALHEAGLAADRLELEITETVMLQDTDATLATLHQFRALGVGIAMDDFGTGYSSLSYLRRFPFDRIKIDQTFVRDACRKRDCGAIVRAVTGLGKELGMATTAEGVETAEQLAAVTLAGCTEVQGFLFSQAVPRCAVPDILQCIAQMLLSQDACALAEPVG